MRRRELRRLVVDIMMHHRVDRLKAALRNGRKPRESYIPKEFSRYAEAEEIIQAVLSYKETSPMVGRAMAQFHQKSRELSLR